MTGLAGTLTGIDHLAFITRDLAATIRFYRDLLGMELHAGIGHAGYRHYFFRAGNTQIAFFEYEGAQAMVPKPHGSPTRAPLGFDHVSFRVATRADLFAVRDTLAAAGIEVSGAVDHGTLWSIYFYDPNNIPLEVSWPCVEVVRPPAIDDVAPLAVAAEGAAPQPGRWPAVAAPTPPEEMAAWPGNGYTMRETGLSQGRVRLTEEYAALPEGQRTRPRPDAAE